MDVDTTNVPGVYRAAGYGGWCMCIRASRLREAWATARAYAGSASLLPSDIYEVRSATVEDVAQYEAMGGKL